MSQDIQVTKEQKMANARFRNLLTLALADGVLDKNELAFLFKKSEKFYITKEELRDLLTSTDELDFESPENDEDRVIQLYQMVEMMMLDGEIDEREYQVCMSVAAGLGYKTENIERTVDRMIDLVENDTTEEEVVELVGEFS